jgi:hypothetical protein
MVDEESDRSPDDSPAPFQQDGLYHTAHVVKDFQHEVNIFDIAIKYYILILVDGHCHFCFALSIKNFEVDKIYFL